MSSSRAPSRRILRGLLGVAILALCVLSLRLMLDPLVRSMIYPVPPVAVPSPPPRPLTAVHLDLPDGGGAVGWFLEVEDEESPRERTPIILFFHGNGENLETVRMAGTFRNFQRMGVAVLAVDYPGYGNSPGTPSEEACHASAEAALGWLSEHHPTRPVVSVGWSLGAAVAVRLAAEAPKRLTALVALSAWTSMPEVARKHFPAPVVKLALSERYDSLSVAPRIELPALVVHGARDQIIPREQGRRLAGALGGEVQWVEVDRAGHNDLLATREVWEALEAFLAPIGTVD